jgi:integrase
MASFAAAAKHMPDRHAGTFVSLVRLYVQSTEFQELRETTRKEYGRILTLIESKFGTLPIDCLNDPEVSDVFIDWADKASPRARDYRLSVISSVLSWAKDKRKIQENHLKGFKHKHSVDCSDKVYSDSDIDAFMAVAPVEMQRAFVLGLETGIRQGDLLRLPWSAYDGTQIKHTQSKTGHPVVIKCTPELKAMLDSIPRVSPIILTNSKGQPFKSGVFKTTFRRALEKAGLKGRVNFHSTRRTFTTRLAEAGCTEAEMAGNTGHTLQSASKILSKYIARTSTIAHNGIAKLENARRTKTVNQAVNQVSVS